MVTKRTQSERQNIDLLATKPRSHPNNKRPLPWCQGPKLKPFPNRKTDVEFVSLLSDPESNGQSHVFEVKIASGSYALKVVSDPLRCPFSRILLTKFRNAQFKYFNDESARTGLGSLMKRISLDILHAHADPFYNECRAYGKLIEAKLNGKVAVRCYGYLIIPAAVESELWQKFGAREWNRPEEEYHKPASKRQALRAIVKDLIQQDVPYTKKTLRKMLRDLKQIRDQGIFPSDITARNYKGGLLVDLSVAMTEPHFLFDEKVRELDRVEAYQGQDLYQFDGMIEDLNLQSWDFRAAPNEEYKAKLRSYERDSESEES
ncbi:MAG: hypothetical protein LQ351_005194 [Letrouitia transgressa]|nr:MAG: hypothetical protein LQ351_005194 [Letrouitia transgressa]